LRLTGYRYSFYSFVLLGQNHVELARLVYLDSSLSHNAIQQVPATAVAVSDQVKVISYEVYAIHAARKPETNRSRSNVVQREDSLVL
jgi:hypothetical protein